MLKKIIKSCSIAFILLGFIQPGIIVAETTNFSYAFIGKTEQSGYRGVLQGLDESNLMGEFLNQQYTLDVIKPENALTADYTKYLAIVADVDAMTFRHLSNKVGGIPLFNISLEDNDLRHLCLTNALHTIPSLQMKTDAIDQWKSKNPDSEATAQAWHPDFVKFAARDLNKRFLAEQKTKMDDNAWAGWAAIRMTSDAVAQANILDAREMLAYLKGDHFLFDGQKGIDMRFRVTGQLQQPMLLVENDKIVAEAPVRGVSKDIDSLGITECPK